MAFPERKSCRRSVRIHRYGVAPPASPVYEKSSPVGAFRQTPPSANRAADSMCKLPRQPRIYVVSWARTCAADAVETWIHVGPDSFFTPLTKSCCVHCSVRVYRNLLGKRQWASTKAAESGVSGDLTGTSDSHSSVDIAGSIQASAHLMYGVRMVQKRRTR